MNKTVENTKKRICYILSGLIIVFCVFLNGENAFISHAEATATVIPESATVRSGAGTDNAAIGSVAAGTALTVAGQTAGSDGQTWYQVTVNGATGYIRADLVNLSESGGQAASGEQSHTETAATVTDSSHSSGTISSDSVNIRKGPASTDAAVGNVKRGAVVEITGEAIGADGQTWYQVSVNGKSGFIRSDLIAEGESGGSSGASGSSGDAGDGGGEPLGEDVLESTEGDMPEENEAEPVSLEPEDDSVTTISNVISTRIIPGDVNLEDVELDESLLAEWASGQYYILYTDNADGSNSWYLYSIKDGQSQEINNLMEQEVETDGSFLPAGNAKIVLIVMAVVILLLIITSIFLAVKLHGYQDYYEEDEDDEEDDDDDEDDEDEEEDDDDEDDGHVNSSRWRPRNFLSRRDSDEDDDEDDEDDEEGDDEEADGEGYLDDDDFEFEFLNLDGKKDIP